MIYGIKEHPELEILRKNWKSIRFEFFNYPKENYVYWRDAIFYDDKYKDSVRGKWEVIMLKHDGEYQDECIKHFTITLEVLKQIKNSKDLDVLKKLEYQLKRIQDIGGFDKLVPSEGIVFTYKGKTYKLTGLFAPVNQLLGLTKYV